MSTPLMKSRYYKEKKHRQTKNNKNVKITQLEGENLRIDHDALRNVFTRPELQGKEFAIISITGKMRTGKSFLMNYVLRYLRRQGWKNNDWMGDDDCALDEDGLPFAGGTNRCTTGICIFDEIFEVPVSRKKKMMVMLMDTQGLFDHDTPEVVNKSMLTLTTLMSSVQIFNSKENIDSQNMEYLKTCIDFARLTAKASASQGVIEIPSVKKSAHYMDKYKGYLKLQNLMFLVRDYPENDEGNDNDEYDDIRDADAVAAVDSNRWMTTPPPIPRNSMYLTYNKKKSDSRTFDFSKINRTSPTRYCKEPSEHYGLDIGREYLDSILSSKKGGEELVKIRSRIKESFDKVECFAMPHPGLKATKPKFKARNKDMTGEFRVYLKKFVEYIVSPRNLVPKRSVAKTVTPREMLNMITACDTIFAEKMIDAQSIMKMNGKAFFSSLCQEAIVEYDTIMKIYTGDEMISSLSHQNAKKRVIQRLSSAKFVGDNDTQNWKQHYLQHFSTVCDDHFDRLKREYEVQLNNKKLHIKSAVRDYEWRVKGELFHPVSDNQFGELHVKHRQAVCEENRHYIDFITLGDRINDASKSLMQDNKNRREAAERELIKRQREEELIRQRQEKKEQTLKMAVEDYESLMKRGLLKTLSDDDFQRLHMKSERTIAEKYVFSADLRNRIFSIMETLEQENKQEREKAEREQERRREKEKNQHWFQWLKEDRHRQQQMLDDLRKRQREIENEDSNRRLSARLLDKSSSIWDVFLTTYHDNTAMQKKKTEILSNISTVFLKEAGKGQLYDQLLRNLNCQYEDAKRRNDHQGLVKRMEEEKKMKREEDEKKKLAERLLMESRNSWNQFLTIFPDDNAMRRKSRKIESKARSEFARHVQKSDALYQQLLWNLHCQYGDAKRQNEQNRDLERQKINSIVDEQVMAIEKEYSEIMVDRHIDENEIKANFNQIDSTKAENYINTLESPDLKKYFKQRLKKKCDEAMKRILEQNKKYEASNNMKSKVPLYKRLLKILQKKAKFVLPALATGVIGM